MREISPEEEAFIAATLKNRESYGTKKVGGSTSSKRRKKGRRKPRFYQRVSTWAAVVMFIPIVLSGFFIANLIRIRNILGPDTVRILTSEKLPSDFKEKADSSGFEWIPQFIELEKNKELIIGGMFTIAIVIVMIMFLIEALLKRHRIRKENAERISNVEDNSDEED